LSVLLLDTETFCDRPIRDGLFAYAEVSETIIIAKAWDDEDVEVYSTEDVPDWAAQLQAEIDFADEVVIHNSPFERHTLAKYGITIPVEKITDTAVLALQHGFPAKLETLCSIFELPVDKAKDKAGKALIQLFSKPRPKNMKLRRATRDTHPEKWAEFLSYAGSDVVSMRELHRLLPRWNASPGEQKLWRLDQTINDRGVQIDLQLAEAAVRAAARATRSLADALNDLTDGAVASATQGKRLLEYLSDEHGFDPGDLTKGNVKAWLASAIATDEVKAILANRLEAAATSPAKYKVLMKGCSADGRLRGTLQFCGAARTGRWGGRLFQPQNLPRPTMTAEEIEDAIAAMIADLVELLFDDIMSVCASCVRGAIIAAPGKKLCIADLSNIEGRMLAWLANEDWKLKAFKEFDAGVGHDLYKITAGRILKKDPGDVTKKERQDYGKVPELACGFQGAVGAFAIMGANLGVNLPEDQVVEIVAAWRKAHRQTVKFWYDLERAARGAVLNPGKTFAVRHLKLRVDEHEGFAYLRMRLPSGRYLCYFQPEVDPNTGKLSYMGIDQYTRQWKRLATYGGKLCIAKGTPVLTERGWVAIEHVRPTDRVWDGVSWVRHAGLDLRGVKEVILAHGVTMTPDHEILTSEGWARASQSKGLERAPCRLPDGYDVRGEQREEIAMAHSLPVRGDAGACRLRAGEVAQEGSEPLVRVPAEKEHRSLADDARDVQPQGLCGVAVDAGPLPPPDAPSVGALRGQRHSGVPGVAGVFCEILGGHGPDVSGRADAGEAGQQRGVQPNQLLLDLPQGAGPEHPGEPQGRHAVGLHHGGRDSRENRVERDDTALPPLAGGAVPSFDFRPGQFAEVFDLLNCGPLRRFTVLGADGLPLIVHNCENATQAASRDVLAYGMVMAEERGYLTVLHVHDELLTETPDTPDFTSDELEEIMATNPPWAIGLPLAAGGFETYRYRKDD
jgi:DNA polymerase bacteriophage-type